MLLQLIFAGVALAAIAGGLWSYNNGLRKEGEAKAVAEYEKQKRVQEEANALKALEGEKYALELLDKAEKRAKQLAAQQALYQRQRREESDARAKVDINFSLWRESAVPDYAEQRVRNAVQPPAPEPNGSRVPPKSSVPTRQDHVAIAAAEVDESRLARIRGILGLANSVDLASR